MAAFAGDMDIEKRTARHHRSGPDSKLPDRQSRTVVHPVYRFHRKLLEQSVGNHGFGTADAFFSRLKNKVNTALKIARFGQITGCTQQHCGVAVMTAGMHFAIMPGAMIEGIVFGHRQCIQISAQANRPR